MLAVVTGGTRGIGFGIVSALLEKGYVCIAAARKESQELLDAQKQYGDKLLFVRCDIGNQEDRALLLQAASELGGANLLVNCAGVAPKIRKDMLEITEEDFDAVVDINLKGSFFLSQAFGSEMKEKGAGRIVNISSISSYTVSLNRAEYCISKAGISMMTKLFAARLAGDGVGVFEISPGVIDTDMTGSVKESYKRKIAEGLLPTPRMGTPDDIAACVLAIAEGRLDYCTGTVLHADGGFHIRRI